MIADSRNGLGERRRVFLWVHAMNVAGACRADPPSESAKSLHNIGRVGPCPASSQTRRRMTGDRSGQDRLDRTPPARQPVRSWAPFGHGNDVNSVRRACPYPRIVTRIAPASLDRDAGAGNAATEVNNWLPNGCRVARPVLRPASGLVQTMRGRRPWLAAVSRHRTFLPSIRSTCPSRRAPAGRSRT
jgi:hypothetical protein